MGPKVSENSLDGNVLWGNELQVSHLFAYPIDVLKLPLHPHSRMNFIEHSVVVWNLLAPLSSSLIALSTPSKFGLLLCNIEMMSVSPQTNPMKHAFPNSWGVT